MMESVGATVTRIVSAIRLSVFWSTEAEDTDAHFVSVNGSFKPGDNRIGDA